MCLLLNFKESFRTTFLQNTSDTLLLNLNILTSFFSLKLDISFTMHCYYCCYVVMPTIFLFYSLTKKIDMASERLFSP